MAFGDKREKLTATQTCPVRSEHNKYQKKTGPTSRSAGSMTGSRSSVLMMVNEPHHAVYKTPPYLVMMMVME